MPSHGPLCAEPSRRERALLQIPLLRAQHVLRASGSWESASFHCCSQKTITPSPLVIAWFHFSETDALLAVCGLRCIVGGASMLRPPQPLSSHATCWPAAALWRAHLHASPSSCGMAGSAAHRTCERLAIDHLTLLHRATHTLVAQSGVGTAPWTRGTRTRRENPCQASFSRPTGAQSAPLAPPVSSAARFRWHSEAFTSPSWLPPAAPRGVGLDGPSTRPGRRRKRHSFAVEAGYTTRKGLSHAGLSHAAGAAAAAPSPPAPFHPLSPPSRPRELTPHPSSDIQDRWGDEWRARRPGWPQRGTES